MTVLECVINISEGRNVHLLAQLADAVGNHVLDVHSDIDHHRSVFTLAGPEVELAARALTTAAFKSLNINDHRGVHPRLGVVDVVPFVPLFDTPMTDAINARNRYAQWLVDTHGVPSFFYGPERSLPTIRKDAFSSLSPDTGPNEPHKQAGSVCVGARTPLVAYNLWLSQNDLELARNIAEEMRSKHVRALGLPMAGGVQVSFNLISPEVVGPMFVYDAVAQFAPITRAELVGLIPQSVFKAIPYERREQLDLSEEKTIEARLLRAGFIEGRTEKNY